VGTPSHAGCSSSTGITGRTFFPVHRIAGAACLSRTLCCPQQFVCHCRRSCGASVPRGQWSNPVRSVRSEPGRGRNRFRRLCQKAAGCADQTPHRQALPAYGRRREEGRTSRSISFRKLVLPRGAAPHARGWRSMGIWIKTMIFGRSARAGMEWRSHGYSHCRPRGGRFAHAGTSGVPTMVRCCLSRARSSVIAQTRRPPARSRFSGPINAWFRRSARARRWPL
jgi:hypothetical protein